MTNQPDIRRFEVELVEEAPPVPKAPPPGEPVAGPVFGRLASKRSNRRWSMKAFDDWKCRSSQSFITTTVPMP